MDQPNNKIDLTGKARISDSNGSADADKILMDQNTGDFTAEGNVTSTHMPDKKDKTAGDTPEKSAGKNKSKDKSLAKSTDKGKDKDADKQDSGGGMLDENEPLHARAKKMISTDNNYQVRYEGTGTMARSKRMDTSSASCWIKPRTTLIPPRKIPSNPQPPRLNACLLL